jgi:hypothetical protein
MVKPAALLAVITFISTTANPLPVGAAGESPPSKATKASYGATDQGSKAQNASSTFMWLGDFDPPVLNTMPAPTLPSGPVPHTMAKPFSAPAVTPLRPDAKLSLRSRLLGGETLNLPPALMGSWDVSSTRTTDDTLPDHWTEIQWLFQRNQLTDWQFEKAGAEFRLVTSRPAVSKTGHVEHLKPVVCDDRLAIFNYEYRINSFRVDSSVKLQLSDDKKSFEGTRRITVFEQDKHVPCATMQYAVHGTRH